MQPAGALWLRIVEREPELPPPRCRAAAGSVLCTGVIRRRKRTEQRERARAMRKLVRDREKLAQLSAGGSADRPIHVTSASVVEVRVSRLTCPQCEGAYRLKDHRAPASGLRSVDVTCQICGVSRTLWFRIVSDEAS